MNADLASILLVEDDPGDVMLVREALAERKAAGVLAVVDDGVKAIEFLRRQGRYADAERPGVVLLDLNLPGKSGAEVLAEIKSDPALATIPVVVLTTSEAEEDVLRCYRQHANAYVTKPVDFERFKQIVGQIYDFFVGLVKLSPDTRGVA
jgi:CheY-like chemotaxis protein